MGICCKIKTYEEKYISKKGKDKTMYKDKTIEELMTEGFTIKMATYYSDCMKKERETEIWDSEYVDWAHSKGFFAESASAYDLSEKNIENYLSDYDYYRMWPLNSWERIWINDKLTLKYMLSGTNLDQYIPKYYFYYDIQRGLIPLIDNKIDKVSMKSFYELLKKERNIACKPSNGYGSKGFFKLSYQDGYYINDKAVNQNDIEEFVNKHKNYIYTEYLFPEKKMAEISPLIHTLRILVVNDIISGPKIIGGYLRFANNTTGSVNYTGKLTYKKEFDYNTEVDWETGFFHSGEAVYSNIVENMPIHPISKILAEGKIKGWDQVLEVVKKFSYKYNLCEYLGFDLCISTEGIKIMEINSHSGIKHIQVIKPLLKEGFSKKYFEDNIKRINGLSEEEKTLRAKLVR